PPSGSTDNYYVARFTGSSWTSPVAVDGRSNDVSSQPAIAIDADGNITALFIQSDGSYNSVYANRYNAQSNSWSGAAPIESINSAVQNIRLGIDESGNLIAAWYTSNNVYVAHYHAASASW